MDESAYNESLRKRKTAEMEHSNLYGQLTPDYGATDGHSTMIFIPETQKDAPKWSMKGPGGKNKGGLLKKIFVIGLALTGIVGITFVFFMSYGSDKTIVSTEYKQPPLPREDPVEVPPVEVHIPEVFVPPVEVHVHIPEPAAPPPVAVHVPEAPAPVVEIHVPEVNVPPVLMPEPKIEDQVYSMNKNDPNTFSNPEEIYAESYHFDWDVDFTRQIIFGTVVYNLVAHQNVAKIIFDTRSNMNIKRVTEKESLEELNFGLGLPYLTFGRPLIVTLPPLQPDSTGTLRASIVIEYETNPEASGLQWLTPEQTGGKTQPFMFSQNEPIHGRSIFPCQDTPSTKATFTATVRAPKELMVLMGAVSSETPELLVTDTTKLVHKWNQAVPVPSYLLAIAVGKLEFRDLGKTSKIWAEAEFVEDAAKDFEDTEKMVTAASSIAGDYVWGRYDMLLLPPSFPYGGMENPCLTFLTPGLVTGDKSLTNVIAHEIAHSWSGNLVTNKNFEHFWLNEGFTVFLERKILGVLQGEQERQFQALGGLLNLKEEIVVNLKEDNPMTQLVLNLTDVDADDSFSIVPYEKGSLFLYYLETKIGGANIMNKFLQIYFDEFARKSIDTTVWKNFFLKFLQDEGQEQSVSDVDWDTWLHKPGMPIVTPEYDRTMYDACVALRDRWVDWDPDSTIISNPFTADDLKNFTSGQIQVFLQLLIDSPKPVGISKLQQMEILYKFQETRNVEIEYRWIRCGLKDSVKWDVQVPKALDFVAKVGRMKFVRPIYQDLYNWGGEVRQQAIDTFTKNIPNMMTVSVNAVKKVLHLDNQIH